MGKKNPFLKVKIFAFLVNGSFLELKIFKASQTV